MAATISIPVSVKASATNLPIAYMRGFLVLLVVAHHAVLAYFPKGPPVPVSLPTVPRWWEAFPVVDAKQFKGFGPFVLFNDTFFMALFFLISGLFVWKSLERKRPLGYMKDRMLRLGVPFAFFALIGPFGYYPAYLQSSVKTGFWHDWMALGNWPAGPVWFIWVLMVMDVVAIAIFSVAPSTFEAVGRKLGRQRRPYGILAGLVLTSAIAYMPMEHHFGPFGFSMWGPFYYQTSRSFYYLVYFLFGLALGSAVEQRLLEKDGPLASYWWQWCLSAAAGFAFLLLIRYLSHHVYYPVLFWRSAAAAAFVLSTALSCFGCFAVFLHFVHQRHGWLDSLFVCSYGIYLTHYFFVSWTQYSLLPAPLPAWLKGGIVFCAASLLSWGLTAFARRSTLIARVI